MSKDFKVKNGLQVTTHITASGHISGSIVEGQTLTADVFLSTPSASITNLTNTNITSSGNISASGIITAEGLVISDDALITDDLEVRGNTSGSSTSTGSFGMGFFDGRVGINTTSPGSSLEVNEGDIRIDTANNATQALRFSDRGSTKAQIQYKDNGETLNILTGGDTNAIEVTNTQNVKFSGPITASGNISGSLTSTLEIGGHATIGAITASSYTGSFVGDGSGLTGVTATVDIDGFDAFSGVPHATQDEFLISDNGTEKRATMTMVANGGFALVSGDATIAAGGALTIADNAVENDMMADNSIGNAELKQDDDITLQSLTTTNNISGSTIEGQILTTDVFLSSPSASITNLTNTNITSSGNISASGLIASSLTNLTTFTALGNLDIGPYNFRARTLQSDVGTGTVPISISSTTKVTNLNADLLDDQEGSYYTNFTNISGNITGSNISASGTSHIFGGDITTTDLTATQITASIISASTRIHAKEIRDFNNGHLTIRPDAELNLGTAATDEINIGRVSSTSCDINMFANSTTPTLRIVNKQAIFAHPITASSNISGSLTSTLEIGGHATIGAITASSYTGSFVGDGSGLTGISTDIDGLSALGGTGVAQSDKFIFSDAGTEKSITFSNLEDAIFGNVSGEATIAAGGALTIAANSIGNNELKQDDDITLQSLTTTNNISGSTIEGQTLTADVFLSAPSASLTNITNTNITASGNYSGSSDSTITIGGKLQAGSKSFLIPRPEGGKLEYGVLEGQQNDVFYRGELKGDNVILLPQEWEWLVNENTITVQLTSIGKHQELFVKEIKDNKIFIDINGMFKTKENIHCYYIIHGTRKDVELIRNYQ